MNIKNDKSEPAEAWNFKRRSFNRGVYPKTKRVNWPIWAVGTSLCDSPSHLATVVMATNLALFIVWTQHKQARGGKIFVATDERGCLFARCHGDKFQGLICLATLWCGFVTWLGSWWSWQVLNLFQVFVPCVYLRFLFCLFILFLFIHFVYSCTLYISSLETKFVWFNLYIFILKYIKVIFIQIE